MDSIELTIVGSNAGKINTQTQKISDPYFSNDYYLIFYKEADPALVYSWKNKIKHYLLGYSHYKTYDPVQPNSNKPYWVRSLLFLGALIWFSIFMAQIIKNRL